MIKSKIAFLNDDLRSHSPPLTGNPKYPLEHRSQWSPSVWWLHGLSQVFSSFVHLL